MKITSHSFTGSARHKKEMLEKAYTALSKNMVRIDHGLSKLITAFKTVTT